MSPRTLAIVGIDGTGKSTVCHSLFRHLARGPLRVRGFSSLQLFDDPDLPLGGLSRTFDVLSGLADERQSAPLKAVALFLGMTLFGPVERFLTETYDPDWLITERHPVIDSMVYARFYLSRIGTAIDPALVRCIDERFEAEGWEADQTWDRVHAWISGLPTLDGIERDFFTLPLALQTLFALPAEELLDRLCALYRTTLPDHALLLTMPVAVADHRIAERQRRDGKPRDLHENEQALDLLQTAYHQACGQLRRLHPRLRVETHEAHGEPLETIIRAIMQEASAPIPEPAP